MNKLLLLFGSILIITGITCSIYAISELKKQEMSQQKSLNKVKESFKEKTIVRAENPNLVKEEYRFKTGDVIGILNIPKLKKELPIIEGTDESELERGVGHYSTTKLPNQQDRIFLAGHRDTVFKKMGELQKGDKLTIQMEAGTHTYEIYETLVVKETDLSVLEPTAPEEVLTLSTCYPFEYLSSTTDRYIVNARRIE
ncbi:class D sortase [Rossellomorea vietnamensis]|uniref:class D sortase n=1 Tax=Rossellomorea vietnamensis TaxID=218284 RepID=UPI003D2CB3FA